MRAHIPIVTLMLLVTPVVVPGLTPATVNAEVITVCWDGSGDYLTIQEGIDAASDGDEVVVCDGVYTGAGNKNLDFGGKAITVRSENGPDNCIIDCQNDGRGFYFHNGETAEAVLDGFTITNGHADEGGAIRCDDSSPTIANCRIVENVAKVGGGGLYCANYSDPTVTNCAIMSNAAGEDGAGVYCCDSNPTIINSVIVWNDAGGSGGGVCATSGARGFRNSLTLTDCLITENTAVWSGGGIRCSQCLLTLTRCALIANVVTGVMTDHAGGGGLSAEDSDVVLTGCTIAGNNVCGGWHTVGSGGGVCCVGSLVATNCTISGNTITVGEWGSGGGIRCLGALTLLNSIITQNTSAYSGGGVGVYYGSAEIINCTFSGNSAPSVGGAISCYSSTATVCNCVLWGNVAQSGPEISFGDSDLTVRYCDIQGGWPGLGNIDADPLFVDPDGPDDDPNTWEDNDHHLSPGSPCIDAGCNWAVPPDTADLDKDGDTNEITPLDLDGEGRFFDNPDTDDTGCGCPPIVDMGAYEFGGTGPQPYPGDLDCDREVDEFDLMILLAAWRISADGDLNCDGVTDHADLGILLAHWGEECP